jgi:predicted O-methyltransferase YrrM
MAGVISDAALQARIDALQAQSAAQEAATNSYFGERARRGELDWDGLDDDANRFMADKLVALEPVKAEFCHMLCLALRARRVVEIGTSHGVSTLYLADAVHQVCGAAGGGVVIGTEYEPAKAAAARANFQAAGVANLIDLREGDLRDTLKTRWRGRRSNWWGRICARARSSSPTTPATSSATPIATSSTT